MPPLGGRLYLLLAPVVTRPRPGGEEKQDLRAAVAANGVPLVGEEACERAHRGAHLVAARSEDDLTLDDDEPGVLLHLVVAEGLARLEADQNGAGFVVAAEHDRGTASAGRLQLDELPSLHREGSLAVVSARFRQLDSAAVGLEVVQLPLGAFQSNCYVVRRPGSDQAVVVDPGWPGETPRIEAALAGASCAGILVTHGDLDHVAGVAELAEATGAPVHVAEAERHHLERPNEFLPAGIEVSVRAHVPEVLLAGDELLSLAGIEFQALRVPGHTAGHLAFAADGCLFSGDVIFAGSVGRTDRPGNSWEALVESIRMLVDRLPPETVVYPGHGPETTLGREVATNPFLAELRAPAR